MAGGRQAYLPTRHGWRFGTLGVALVIWSGLATQMASWLFLPMWLLVSQLIFAGSLEAARLKRRAWLGQYLYRGSSWHRRLRGGVPMIIGHQLLGIALGLVLLVKLRLLSPWLWPVLGIAAIGLLGLRVWLRGRLGKHVLADCLGAVTRRLAVPLVAIPLALAVALIDMTLPQPWMVGLGWQDAMLRHLPTDGADTLLGTIERLARLAELTQQWALQNTLGSVSSGGPMVLLGWSLALLMQAAFAWAFVRLLVGASALRDRQRI